MHEHSPAFGKTLAGWNEIYERWAYGGLTLPTDGNGNAVVVPPRLAHAAPERSW